MARGFQKGRHGTLPLSTNLCTGIAAQSEGPYKSHAPSRVFSRWSSRMHFDTVAAALTAALSVLPATLHMEVSTGLVVLGLAGLWLWRGRS